MTKSNDLGNVETTDFPIHRIQEAHDSWRQIYEGLQLIESQIEAGVRVPLDSTFAGMLGCEWQPRLAELPERLIVNLSTRVLPAITACCRHPDAPPLLRDIKQNATWQITSAMAEALRAKAIISKVCVYRPTRQTQLLALKAAKSLLAGLLMELDDILVAAKT